MGHLSGATSLLGISWGPVVEKDSILIGCFQSWSGSFLAGVCFMLGGSLGCLKSLLIFPVACGSPEWKEGVAYLAKQWC